MSSGRAFVVEGPGRFALREFPLPACGDDDGLLQVLVAGVDGTDAHYLAGDSGRRALRYPFIAGDEAVGRVVAIGARAAERWGLSAGDLAVVEQHLGCGRCPACRDGSAQFCAEGRGYGARIACDAPPHFWGAFAEYLYLAPQAQVAPLGDLDPEVGILVPSMLANGLRWVGDVGGTRPGDAVAILGAGQQALGCVLAAVEHGAGAIVVSGLPGDEGRLAAAARLGATTTVMAAGAGGASVAAAAPAARGPDVAAVVSDLTGGAGADVVVDVTGSPAGLDGALTLVARRGTIVLAGLSRTAVELLPDRLVWDEIALRGAYSHDRCAFERALALASRHEARLRGVVSHRYALQDTARAVGALARAPRPVKVVLKPDAALEAQAPHPRARTGRP